MLMVKQKPGATSAHAENMQNTITSIPISKFNIFISSYHISCLTCDHGVALLI